VTDLSGVRKDGDSSTTWALCALAARRRSGCALIWRDGDDGPTGEVFFDRGRLVAAVCGPAQGPAALATIARRLETGQLRFFPRAIPEQRNVDIAPEELALYLTGLSPVPGDPPVRSQPERVQATGGSGRGADTPSGPGRPGPAPAREASFGAAPGRGPSGGPAGAAPGGDALSGAGAVPGGESSSGAGAAGGGAAGSPRTASASTPRRGDSGGSSAGGAAWAGTAASRTGDVSAGPAGEARLVVELVVGPARSKSAGAPSGASRRVVTPE
jgi:hypothetical protein